MGDKELGGCAPLGVLAGVTTGLGVDALGGLSMSGLAPLTPRELEAAVAAVRSRWRTGATSSNADGGGGASSTLA